MLELRPSCELCDRDLPPDSSEAMICFTPRPIRPKALLDKRPASTQRVRYPRDAAKHGALLARYRSVPPEQR